MPCLATNLSLPVLGFFCFQVMFLQDNVADLQDVWREFRDIQYAEWPAGKAEAVAGLAARCLLHNPRHRPTMEQVSLEFH